MRMVKEIQVDGRTLRALFDTGSLRSYVTRESSPPNRVRVPLITVGLGGRPQTVQESCIVLARIEGLEFDMTAYVVPELGETEHGRLDAIVGALTMEAWWIKLDPHSGELDLSQLRRREFTEY